MTPYHTRCQRGQVTKKLALVGCVIGHKTPSEDGLLAWGFAETHEMFIVFFTWCFRLSQCDERRCCRALEGGGLNVRMGLCWQ